jgi:predicted ATPase
LELAAARLRMLTVDQIAGRLNDRFRLLTGGRRTALPRQQTLQAMIDWSWNLLSEPERVLLRRLSVFSGGWTLEAGQEVTGFQPLDEFQVFDALEQLINKSLVDVQHPPQGEARYNMLESIRQYAQDKLFEAGEGETLRDRHVDTYVAMVESFGETGLGSEYITWMKRFEVEADNLRTVVAWIAEDRPRLALRFTGILTQFGTIWMHYREAKSWLEPAIERARMLLEEDAKRVDMVDFIRALRSLGWLLVTHGDMTRGHSTLDESISLARKHGEHRLMAIAISMKAQAMGTNVTPEIIEQMEAVIDLSRQNDYQFELIMALFSTGQAYIVRGDLKKGRIYLDEVIQLAEALLADSFLKAWIYYPLALLAREANDPAEAERFFLLAIEASEKMGDQRLTASARSELAHLYRQAGRLDEAEAAYRLTIQSWQEQGHLSAATHQVECFAYLAIPREQYRLAARLLGAAASARQRLNALSTESGEIAELEQAMSELAGAISEEERDRVMAAGAQMSLDDAVHLALCGTTASQTPNGKYTRKDCREANR